MIRSNEQAAENFHYATCALTKYIYFPLHGCLQPATTPSELLITQYNTAVRHCNTHNDDSAMSPPFNDFSAQTTLLRVHQVFRYYRHLWF